jgi:hypothetical protein
MIKLKYKIQVQSAIEKAYNTMLGLEDMKTYNQWTASFNPSSTYEGSWEKGSKMLFIGTDEQGNKGGMISRIVENIPNQFVSIQHYGLLDGNLEITSGPKVEPWAGGFENYTFEFEKGITTITVEVDAMKEYHDYFNTAFPKALELLKQIIERE